jgi:hypothetical protein
MDTPAHIERREPLAQRPVEKLWVTERESFTAKPARRHGAIKVGDPWTFDHSHDGLLYSEDGARSPEARTGAFPKSLGEELAVRKCNDRNPTVTQYPG